MICSLKACIFIRLVAVYLYYVERVIFIQLSVIYEDPCVEIGLF